MMMMMMMMTITVAVLVTIVMIMIMVMMIMRILITHAVLISFPSSGLELATFGDGAFEASIHSLGFIRDSEWTA